MFLKVVFVKSPWAKKSLHNYFFLRRFLAALFCACVLPAPLAVLLSGFCLPPFKLIHFISPIWRKNFGAENYIAKADFCRLELGTFLDRIGARHDINEPPNTADFDYNIRLLICQITLLQMRAPIKYQYPLTNPRR